MMATVTPVLERKTRVAPAGVVRRADGSFFVTVGGSPTGPAVDGDVAMDIARWLNDGAHAAIIGDPESSCGTAGQRTADFQLSRPEEVLSTLGEVETSF